MKIDTKIRLINIATRDYDADRLLDKSRPRRQAMKCFCIGIAIALSSLTTWSQPRASRQQYESASRSIYAHASALERASESVARAQQPEAVIGQLHRMIVATIEAALAEQGASSDMIRKSIIDLQGEDSLGQFLPDTGIPFVDLSQRSGFSTCVVGFAVMNGGEGIPDVRSYLRFYSKASGSWELISEQGTEFRGTTFTVATIVSPLSNEVWYLAHGTTIGDTAARLKLELFGFDGYTARHLWGRDGLRRGTVAVSNGRVTLEYDEALPARTLAIPRRVTQRLRATLNGLEQ
jgi:hypothetical protein